MRLNLFILSAAILFSTFNSSHSQNTTPFRWGASFEAGLNFHNSQFSQLPGFPAIPVSYNGGAGLGYCIGINSDILLKGGFRAGLFAGYDMRGTKLAGDESTVFTINGAAVAGTIRHNLDADIRALSARPSIIWNSEKYEFIAGVTFSRAITRTFKATQTVTEPQGISLSSQPFGGELPNSDNIAISPSVSAAARYATGNFALIPYIRAEFGLTDIAGVFWRGSTVRAGLSVLVEPRAAPPDSLPVPLRITPDSIYVRDTTTIEKRGLESERIVLESRKILGKRSGERQAMVISESYRREIPRPIPFLRAHTEVAFVLADGAQSDEFRVDIHRVITKRFFPMLPAVFFNYGSADIPIRYAREEPGFPLAPYYRLLDVIAARLAAIPQATLTISALLNNDSLDAMREMRAERLQNALQSKARIFPKQIKLNNEYASPSTEAAIREENERVTFSANDPAVLAPLIYYDTIINANPPIIRFFPRITSDKGVASWRLQTFADGKIVKEFAGEDEPPSALDWRIGENKLLLHLKDSLLFRLTAVNYSGDTVISPIGEIRFARDSIVTDSKSETFDAIEYSIVFFDYNSTEISRRDRIALERLKRWQTFGKTFIYGSTDSLGKAQYNLELSQKRAESAARLLGLDRGAARGLGGKGAEFDNRLPEGRMFNRRVKISIVK